MARIAWNGTTEEALALLQVLRTNCECQVDDGRTIGPCASHLMLAHDQRAIDGLLFMRRMAARLLEEEFSLGSAELSRKSPLAEQRTAPHLATP